MLMRASASACLASALSLTSGGSVLGEFVLVLDLAEDFFDDVFDCHDAGGAAVFVGDDGDVDFLADEFVQQFADGLGFGDEQGGAEDGTEAEGLAGTLDAVAREPAHQVFDVEDADDVVGGALVDGDAGVGDLADHLDDAAEVVGQLHGLDVGAGGHHLCGGGGAELDDGPRSCRAALRLGRPRARLRRRRPGGLRGFPLCRRPP
jgi:hypothetical protein